MKIQVKEARGFHNKTEQSVNWSDFTQTDKNILQIKENFQYGLKAHGGSL